VKLWKKIRWYLFALLVFSGILFIIFNEDGVIKYYQLKSQLMELQVQIDSLDEVNTQLEAEIDSLTRKVPAKIEQTAREKYDMLRKGETKVEVIER